MKNGVNAIRGHEIVGVKFPTFIFENEKQPLPGVRDGT